MQAVFLSRRNLLTLLSKLDRAAEGNTTFCSIIKSDNHHPLYPQTMDRILVTAVEDAVYYAHREPGPVDTKDEPK